MSFCSYTFHFWVSCTSKLIFIVKPLYNISSVGTRLRSGGNKQKRDETAKNRQAKQAEWWTRKGAPSSLSLPRLSRSLRSPIFFAFPRLQSLVPGHYVLHINKQGIFIAYCFSSLPANCTKSSLVKEPRALLQKDLWKSLKELHNKIFTKVTVPWLSTSCSKLRWL